MTEFCPNGSELTLKGPLRLTLSQGSKSYTSEGSINPTSTGKIDVNGLEFNVTYGALRGNRQQNMGYTIKAPYEKNLLRMSLIDAEGKVVASSAPQFNAALRNQASCALPAPAGDAPLKLRIELAEGEEDIEIPVEIPFNFSQPQAQ